MNDLIERLDQSLAENRADYYAKLQPGVTDEALGAFEARFSLALPASFRAFYKWRNGQQPRCFKSFHENRMFSSLEDIADTKQTLDGMIGADFKDPRWWRRGWVPFLSNGGGDHLCLDAAAEDGGTPGQIIEFWHADADRNAVYETIEAWLAEAVEEME